MIVMLGSGSVDYITIIKYAILVFPVVAFLITVPFILLQYHKYGSILFMKTVITYLFVLYLMCAYFLIILPLPSRDSVLKLTTPRIQLIPFKFVFDFIRETSFNLFSFKTYLVAIKESCFYVPIFNILLTMPFGIYLRYYLKCDLKRTVFFTFLLSLFFELTQLSGLYFIYPRGYRLCDVDDLILNTLGGLIGYFVAGILIKFLPSRDELDKTARVKGRNVSGFKRTVAFFLDLFLFFLFDGFLLVKLPYYYSIIVITLYYFVVPSFFRGKTLGEAFLNLMISDMDGLCNIKRIIYRRILFIIFYVVSPYILFRLLSFSKYSFIVAILIVWWFVFFIVSAFKYLFTDSQLLFERLSKTEIISTIK